MKDKNSVEHIWYIVVGALATTLKGLEKRLEGTEKIIQSRFGRVQKLGKENKEIEVW